MKMKRMEIQVMYLTTGLGIDFSSSFSLKNKMRCFNVKEFDRTLSKFGFWPGLTIPLLHLQLHLSLSFKNFIPSEYIDCRRNILTLFTVRKVMFSQTSVSHSVHGGVWQTPPGIHPQADTPFPADTLPGRHSPTARHSPSRRLLQRTIRILLGYILVVILYFIYIDLFRWKKSGIMHMV